MAEAAPDLHLVGVAALSEADVEKAVAEKLELEARVREQEKYSKQNAELATAKKDVKDMDEQISALRMAGATRSQLTQLQQKLAARHRKVKELEKVIEKREEREAALESAQLPEIEEDKLVRLGQMTPFEAAQMPASQWQRRANARLSDAPKEKEKEKAKAKRRKPDESDEDELVDVGDEEEDWRVPEPQPLVREVRSASSRRRGDRDEWQLPSDDDIDMEVDDAVARPGSHKRMRKQAPLVLSPCRVEDDDVHPDQDDWHEDHYRQRMVPEDGHAENEEDVVDDGEAGAEQFDVVLEGGFSIPDALYQKLYEYQRVGVKWLWELHCQETGGIIADEMGLGKTIQMISFLAGLLYSDLLPGPILIVCPATVMRQWLREFHKWWPPFRVRVLHASAHTGDSVERMLEKLAGRNQLRVGDVVITSYETVRLQQETLLKLEWAYAVLDEGHKIRNPDAEITLACKRLDTCHRIVLTGAPIQNSLKELWSLFDFIFPGKLGTLPVFQTEFALPIAFGGYSNASPAQIQTAFRCATVLRDLIRPYLLRRLKADVGAQLQLPLKSEQVLFCQLTEEQRTLYREYLRGNDVERVLAGDFHALKAIDVLRKICNHPDLSLAPHERPEDYGHWERSGKLRVVHELLPLWQAQDHRVLLFCQTRQMLDIVEAYVRAQDYEYRRMDGNTPIRARLDLVDQFNNNPSIFIFILTTKVGGLGINLIGADRVILFDPDWNPCIDTQARERAWRIGQTKPVTVYRLMAQGAIEEKIYHRQIFKHFLTLKVLKDPRQRRLFKTRDIRDLFTFEEAEEDNETMHLFQEAADPLRRPSSSEALAPDASEGDDAEREAENSNSAASNGPQVTDVLVSRDGEEDQAILAKLSGRGVSGALAHEQVMAGGPDAELLELEASKVAKRAVLALKKSREASSRVPLTVPTWTGRHGSAGAPGVSSADVLAALRESKGQSSDHVSPSAMEDSNQALLRSLQQFLQRQGGSASTDAIVNHFRERVPADGLPLFKQLLRSIASFDRGSRAWRLLPEFAN